MSDLEMPKTGDNVPFQMGMTVYTKAENDGIGNVFTSMINSLQRDGGFCDLTGILVSTEKGAKNIAVVDTTKSGFCLVNDKGWSIGFIDDKHNRIKITLPLTRFFSTPQALMQADIQTLKDKRSEHWDEYTRVIEDLTKQIEELDNGRQTETTNQKAKANG